MSYARTAWKFLISKIAIKGVFWGPQAYFLDPDGNKLEIYAGPGAQNR